MPDIMLTAAPLDATMGLVGFNVCKNIALKQDEAGIGALVAIYGLGTVAGTFLFGLVVAWLYGTTFCLQVGNYDHLMTSFLLS